jgi:pantoate--beta-alanine ligase
MIILSTIPAMKAEIQAVKDRRKTIGFVPTMGALHEGHLSLVRAARRGTEVTVASIFVNPTQFGPAEDFKAYPRNLDHDATMLQGERADLLFHPSAEEMYSQSYRTFVEVQDLQNKLCGRSRPGHFRGVCTVVLKLFEIVRPDVAFFGQKDAQQAIILQRMVRDLDLDVRLEVLPIVREADGLAMSSRNAYLSPDERRAALVLSRSLREVEGRIADGERSAAVLLARMREMIGREPLARIDYTEVVDPDRLESVPRLVDGTLIALAVFFGKTRLIDNAIVSLEK